MHYSLSPPRETKAPFDKKSGNNWKEYNFDEKLEKISDLVRYSITFMVFSGNPILWGMGEKFSVEKVEKMNISPNHFSLFLQLLIKISCFQSFYDLFIKQTLRAYYSPLWDGPNLRIQFRSILNAPNLAASFIVNCWLCWK